MIEPCFAAASPSCARTGRNAAANGLRSGPQGSLRRMNGHPERLPSPILRHAFTRQPCRALFDKLTDGSRVENLWAALCLRFAYYNFCRVHETLRVTPAMEARIAAHIWTIRELLS